MARLRPLLPSERIWTVTNAEQAAAVNKQVPATSRKRVLVEPFGRNTAAAIALAAFHIRSASRGDALMAVLPADHYIAQAAEYRKIVSTALKVAREPGRMVVLGIPPTRPETGFGYIERSEATIGAHGIPVYPVKRFAEKPALEIAKEYAGFGKLSVERRNVFLEGFDFSGRAEKLFAGDIQRFGIAVNGDRQAQLCVAIEGDLRKT